MPGFYLKKKHINQNHLMDFEGFQLKDSVERMSQK